MKKIILMTIISMSLQTWACEASLSKELKKQLDSLNDTSAIKKRHKENEAALGRFLVKGQHTWSKKENYYFAYTESPHDQEDADWRRVIAFIDLTNDAISKKFNRDDLQVLLGIWQIVEKTGDIVGFSSDDTLSSPLNWYRSYFKKHKTIVIGPDPTGIIAMIKAAVEKE
jgi:hypothetical protein